VAARSAMVAMRSMVLRIVMDGPESFCIKTRNCTCALWSTAGHKFGLQFSRLTDAIFADMNKVILKFSCVILLAAVTFSVQAQGEHKGTIKTNFFGWFGGQYQL
jgi:hypothetical protein